MITKNPWRIKELKTGLNFLLMILILLPGCRNIINCQDGPAWKYSSGNDEIDQIRKEIRMRPTDSSNYEYRGLMITLWKNALQQQGAVLAGRFKHIDLRSANVASIKNREDREEKIARYSELIDKGYMILDSIQNEITEDPLKALTPLAPNQKNITPPLKTEKPWPQYQGSTSNIGFNGTDGPVYGRIGWKFPVGLAWESRPVVEGDKVYLISPGIRNILFTLDINTGEIINTAKQLPGFTYYLPAYASSPIVLKDFILAREIGSFGNQGTAKEVAYISKKTMQIGKEIYSGAVDYRVGYAPLAANERFMVYPYSVHDIHLSPPIAQTFNRIICKDTKTGVQIWDINIGHTFAEPLLDDDRIFVGNMSGYLYCLKANPINENDKSVRIKAREDVIAWHFKADDAINRRVATDAKQVYFGANDGTIYCLNKETGKLTWKFTVENPIAESFRHFSTPFISGNRIFIGSADKNLYCLNASTGTLIFKYQSSDWIRACPAANESNVYFASMNGDLYNIDYSGKQPELIWKKPIGDHWVYADVVLSGDKVLLNNSDLYSYCVNAKNGDILWRFSILKSFHQKDGYRILTDQLAGGAYHQSKATAADGKVFIGTPSRFVYAIDAENGKEIWKYEVGAAISGAPVYDNNKIYIGQQGGEEGFYCLDAKTGKLIWKQNVGWVWGSAVVSDGMVFIPAVDGYMYGLNADNGDIIWRYRADKSVCSEPLVMGG